jgi:hypothetical protein
MEGMDDSIAHPRPGAPAWASVEWKAVAGHTAAVLAAIPFLVAGVWKITDPIGASVRLMQALVPGNLALAGAVGFGIAELFGAVLIIVPMYRRWGAIIISALLVAFMVYIGINYTALTGEECNCFPWIERAIGPGFFISDGVMLLFAVVAGIWARPSRCVRNALLVLLATTVFAGASLGVAVVRSAAVRVPAVVEVEGRPFALREGRVLLYFFNPECTHCLAAARDLSHHGWNNVTVLAVATEQPRFAGGFLRASGLTARLVGPASPGETPAADTAALMKEFNFVSVPYAVALSDGEVLGEFRYFDANEPAESLRKLGFID